MKSPQSKVPKNLASFLKNGENKTRLIEILKEELAANKEMLLHKLQCQQIMFSMDQLCYKITTSDVALIEQLSSNQEEADTKLSLHAAISLGMLMDLWLFLRCQVMSISTRCFLVCSYKIPRR